jgi:hypothetical protein
MTTINQSSPAFVSPSVPRVEVNQVLRLVYTWMGLGLLTTAVVAWFTATNDSLLTFSRQPGVWLISIIAQFGLVIALSFGINSRRITPNIAAFMFFAYAALTGFTLSAVFLYFVQNEPNALTSAFGTTAVLFGVMTLYGFTTKNDLTRLGNYLFMGLIGLVIVMLFNMIIGSSALGFLISVVGVILFTGLTAYDTQKIKEMSLDPVVQSDGNLALKLSVVGALTLYLDFLNLFLFLLQLFSGGDD